ncbi:MAG: hypothetical protein VX346_10030 [Planctomycetota bacterium]|nr:hypothetical protein [Planctomycetota bacterium]
MDDSFDPYRIWLGIPLSEQPADHYRLLGIARFETDPEVIENAANRQMSYLRTFQSGDHVGLAQRLLNEVSAAKICLLHPDRRNAYDSQLQASPVTTSEAATSATLPHDDPPANQSTPATQINSVSSPEAPPLPQVRTALPPRTRRSSPWPLLLAMMLIVILLGALIVFFNRRDPSKPNKPSPSPTGARPIDSSDNRLQQPAWAWQAVRPEHPGPHRPQIPIGMIA